MSAPLRRLDRNESKLEGSIQRAVVAGGNGQVGRMFTSRLASSGIEVTSVDTDLPATDRKIEGAHYERGDITQPSGQLAQELTRADLVLLAVPEPVALAAVAPLAKIMLRGALLADTLSVKTRFANRICKQASG